MSSSESLSHVLWNLGDWGLAHESLLGKVCEDRRLWQSERRLSREHNIQPRQWGEGVLPGTCCAPCGRELKLKRIPQKQAGGCWAGETDRVPKVWTCEAWYQQRVCCWSQQCSGEDLSEPQNCSIKDKLWAPVIHRGHQSQITTVPVTKDLFHLCALFPWCQPSGSWRSQGYGEMEGEEHSTRMKSPARPRFQASSAGLSQDWARGCREDVNCMRLGNG